MIFYRFFNKFKTRDFKKCRIDFDYCFIREKVMSNDLQLHIHNNNIRVKVFNN